MKDVTWSDDEGKQVEFVKTEHDNTFIVDGVATNVPKGTTLQRTGHGEYWSVNESEWKAAGFNPAAPAKKAAASKPPAKKTAAAPAKKTAAKKTTAGRKS